MIGLETRPIRSKSITNRDWLARVFPRFVPATCNYVSFDWFTGQGCLYLFWLLRVIQKESTTSSLTSGKTALYHDCLHWNFCATVWILSQKITFLTTPNVENKFWRSYQTTWKYWWNETDDETFRPVLAQFPWTLKYVFSSFHGKRFWRISQATVYTLSFKKRQKGL